MGFAYPQALLRLVREFSKLPSIGERTATRLAFFLLYKNPLLASALSTALIEALAVSKLCSTCYGISEAELCSICSDESRDKDIICVVEKPADIIAIERVGEYNGLYHVLHGLWAPRYGSQIEDLKYSELLERITAHSVREVILATGATLEGDATALFIANELLKRGLKTSRIAQGIPKGGELEYADEVTLSRALADRREL
jgi:recombination protein RecR